MTYQQYDIDPRGVRINPRCKPSENIYAQIAAHKAKRAKGTTKQQIEKLLND